MIWDRDYEKRRRYRQVIARLRNVNNRIRNLDNALGNLESLLDRSINIDDKPYKGDVVTSARNNVSSASSTITGSIIPSLERHL